MQAKGILNKGGILYMNVNDLHDAINQIDDDMLQSVDNLRNKPEADKSTHRKSTWIYVLPLIACLFIIVSISIKLFKGTEAEVIDEGLEIHGTISSDKDSTIADTTKPSDFIPSDIIPSEAPSVIVEIMRWEHNGFTGRVTDIVDTNIFDIGTMLTVRFSSTVYLAIKNGNETKYEQAIPNANMYPIGTSLCVQFVSSNTSDFDNKIIYATIISKITNSLQ